MAESYERCIRCTICVENCPVFKVNPEYPGPKQAGPDAMRFRMQKEKKVDSWVTMCTQCRRCEQVCPHDVKPASLILEAQLNYVDEKGPTASQILFSNFQLISTLASFFAPLANFIASLPFVKIVMNWFGVRKDIPFPKFSFFTMQREKETPKKGVRKAAFFHGCYLNGNDPDTGRYIVQILQDLGIEIITPKQVCCGLPALANGNRKKAVKFAEKNASILIDKINQGYDILYSCTSCGHTLIHTYPQLLPNQGEKISENSWNIYEYLEMLVDEHIIIPNYHEVNKTVAYHIPCHLKGTGKPYPAASILKKIPHLKLSVLDQHCCGFSGSYGFKEKHKETAIKLGKRAAAALEEVHPDVIISDCGACRMQLESFTGIKLYDPIGLVIQAFKKKTPGPKKRSLFTRLLIFAQTLSIITWLIIFGVIGAGAVAFLASASVVGYVAFDYAWNNPKFCITCHTPMQESYDTWEVSTHKDVNCHACHLLSPEEGINYGIHLVRGLPERIPPRPKDKIIVPSAYCMDCHWGEKKGETVHNSEKKDITHWVLETGQKVRKVLFKTGPDGENVTSSRFHAIHFFNGQNDCSVCHGKQQLHVFETQPEDCLECHENQQEQAHTAKGVELACLDCHTDRTADLNPDRKKCLACHEEGDTARQELLAAATMDVKFDQDSEELFAKAAKAHLVENAPMEGLACATCHTPHQKEEAKPTADNCISCHPSIKNVEQHTLHLNFVGGDCTKCHQPHSWTMTEEQAQKDCAKCHQYYKPVQFIQAKKE